MRPLPPFLFRDDPLPEFSDDDIRAGLVAMIMEGARIDVEPREVTDARYRLRADRDYHGTVVLEWRGYPEADQRALLTAVRSALGAMYQALDAAAAAAMRARDQREEEYQRALLEDDARPDPPGAEGE